MKVEINQNERLDDLQLNGLRIIQKVDGFCYGIDAVLLANFASVKRGGRAVDLGTGTGIIPLIMSQKTEAGKLIGIEIQPEMAEMANRSVQYNGLEERIQILNQDVRLAVDILGLATFDTVVTNPPYIKYGGGLLNPSDTKAISRHEILCKLEDIIKASSQLLRPNGAFFMIHRPDRLVDILCLMRQWNIEPKLLRMVHPYAEKEPNLILVHGHKFGNVQLKVMKPLTVYNSKGEYTDEVLNIYGRYEVKEG